MVIVEGIVPPASVGRLSAPSVSGRKPKAIPGTIFDLRVQADPQTGTTSLEGGRLFTTDLRPGPLMTGSRQASIIAEGKGPLFINPFFDPKGSSAISINKLSAVLNGGEVLEDIPLKLMLTNPSHTRSACPGRDQSTLPPGSGQRNPTASGKSDPVIEPTVPPSMRDQSEIFIELVKHPPSGRRTPVGRARPAACCWPTRTTPRRSTGDGAPSASGAFPSSGNSTTTPRNSPAWWPCAAEPSSVIRSPRSTSVNSASRAIWECDSKRPNSSRTCRPTRGRTAPCGPCSTTTTSRCDSGRTGLAERQDLLLERKVVDKKFVLDRVSSEHPMIYISQSSMPRIAVFGKDLEIDRPVTMGAWDNRLLVRDSEGTDHELEIYYRANKAQSARIIEADANAFDFLQTISRRPTIEDPRPGLDLSYSETVGAIHALWAQGHLTGDFKAEQDRLLAAIRRYGPLEAFEERPEFDSGGDEASGTPNLEESLNRRPATIRPLMDKRDGSAPAPSGSTPPPSSGSLANGPKADKIWSDGRPRPAG